jgi:hypothetical protein
MSRLLENIIRKFLFEQVVRGDIERLSVEEKQQSIAAGAVQGFKCIIDQEISDEEWEQNNPRLEKTSINLGRHYQKNIVKLVNNFFNEKTVAGYNDVLDENHIVIMGNTPTVTESFSIMFWIFTLDKFFEFSIKKEQEKVTFKDKDVQDVSVPGLESVIRPTRFSILQSKCLTYTEYLKRYTTTNTALKEINQGVQQDVITLAATEKNREKIEFIESLEFPKEISTFTCFAIVHNDDTIQQVINIDSNIQEQIYTYITYQYDEWIKWSKNIQGISNEKATSENSYKVRQACNIEKSTWGSVKVLNDLIKRQYSETQYNNLLFDDVKWETTFITDVKQAVEKQNTKLKVYYKDRIENIFNTWNDTNNVSRLIWDEAFPSFGSYQEYLKQLYTNLPNNLKYLIIEQNGKYKWNDSSTRFKYNPNAKIPDLDSKTSLSFKTEAADIIRETGIEYLNIILQSLSGISFYDSSCNLDTGEVNYTSTAEQKEITNRVTQRITLSASEYKEEYFDFVIDQLNKNLNVVNPPDIDPFTDQKIEPVTPPNIE